VIAPAAIQRHGIDDLVRLKTTKKNFGWSVGYHGPEDLETRGLQHPRTTEIMFLLAMVSAWIAFSPADAQNLALKSPLSVLACQPQWLLLPPMSKTSMMWLQ
jgi:hypothetical protein